MAAAFTTALLAQPPDYVKFLDQGIALERAGNYADAAAAFREAVAIAEREKLGDRAVANALNSLGMSYDELGKPSEAARQYRRAISLMEHAKGKDSADYAVLLTNLAADYAELGHMDTAESMVQKSIAIYSKQVPPDKARMAISQTILADLAMAKGRYRWAEALLMQALDSLRHKNGMEKQEMIAVNNLAVIRRLQSRYAEASDLFRETIRMIEADLGPDHPRLLQPLNNLALTYFDAGNSTAALENMLRAVTIAETRLGTGHPTYGSLLVNYSNLLKKTGRKDEAKRLETRGKSVMLDSARTNGYGQTVDAMFFRK